MSQADTIALYALGGSGIAIVISFFAALFSYKQAKAANEALSPFVEVVREYGPSHRKGDDDMTYMAVVLKNHGSGLANIGEVRINGNRGMRLLDYMYSPSLSLASSKRLLSFGDLEANKVINSGDRLELIRIDVDQISDSAVKDEIWRQFQSLRVEVDYKSRVRRKIFVAGIAPL